MSEYMFLIKLHKHCYEVLCLIVEATIQKHSSPFPAAVTRRSWASYRRSNDNKCTAEVEHHFILILGFSRSLISKKVTIPTDAL